MKTSSYLIAAALALVTPLASAITGNDMATGCRSFLKSSVPGKEQFDAGVCGGYMLGVVGGFLVGRGDKDGGFCIPEEGYTVEQGAKVMMKYFDKHPEQLNEEIIVLWARAFQQAFPCKK